MTQRNNLNLGLGEKKAGLKAQKVKIAIREKAELRVRRYTDVIENMFAFYKTLPELIPP